MREIDLIQIVERTAEWLFGYNGYHLLQWYFVLLIIDVAVGLVKAGKFGMIKSKTYLKGLLKKCCAIFVVVIANMLDDLLVNYMHVDIGASIADVITFGLLLYEALSIVENLQAIGVFTGRLAEYINKVIDISNEKVQPKKDEDKNKEDK